MPSTPNIALIRPPLVRAQGVKAWLQSTPPIGLAYLQGSLQSAGFKVCILDAYGEAIEQRIVHEHGYVTEGLTAHQIVSRIDPSTSLVGVSCMFSNEWIYYRQVLQAIRLRLPNALIVIGGEHATACPEWCLKQESAIDVVVLGEGEKTIVDLAEKFHRGGTLAEVHGIAYRDPRTGNILRTAPRPRIEALATMARPQWSDVPLENYFQRGLGNEQYGRRTMPMMASRGCPYQCTFCSSPFMYGTQWIARDPSDVIDEIKYYVETYQVDYIEFYDLTTIVKREWILQFASLLAEAKLDIQWTMSSGTRSEALDAEVLETLAASGCNRIYYAPESGSTQTLKRIKKRITPSKMLNSMRHANRLGMYTRANLIAGLPDDTPRDLFATFFFVVQMAFAGVQDVMCFPFVPYPGSELHEKLVSQKILNPDDSEYEAFLLKNTYNNLGKVRSWNHRFSHRTILIYSMTVMITFQVIKFARRPWRIFQTMHNILRLQPNTAAEKHSSVLLYSLLFPARKFPFTARNIKQRRAEIAVWRIRHPARATSKTPG